MYNTENKKRLLSSKKTKTVFPSPDLIYRSIFVIENDPNYHKETNKDTSNNNSNGRVKITNEEQEINENSKESEAWINGNSSNNEVKIKEEENSNDNQNNNHHHLYMNKNSSRFDFIVKEKEMVNNYQVPFHIQKLINKKINMHRLMKYMKHHTDIDRILQNEALSSEKNDEWLQFINETNTITQDTENTTEDDCIKDFENINSFIIDKCIGDNQSFI